MTHTFEAVFHHLATWGLPLIIPIIGVIEFAYGLYENHWTKNERSELHRYGPMVGDAVEEADKNKNRNVAVGSPLQLIEATS